MLKGEFKSYWSETASYEAIVPLINMNYDGLENGNREMLSGEVKVNTATFKNDAVKYQSKDDVWHMIHLATWDMTRTEKTAFRSNEEIRQIDTCGGKQALEWSVAEPAGVWEVAGCDIGYGWRCSSPQVEKIHDDYVSAIQYNNENSLSSVLAIAYLSAMQYYFKPVQESCPQARASQTSFLY